MDIEHFIKSKGNKINKLLNANEKFFTLYPNQIIPKAYNKIRLIIKAKVSFKISFFVLRKSSVIIGKNKNPIKNPPVGENKTLIPPLNPLKKGSPISPAVK